MITGRRVHLEARLRERGYTLDEIRPAIVSETGDFVTIDETHAAYPRTPKAAARRGLGDLVAAGLDAVGITKERVQTVAAKVGIRDCGCKQRQQRLNELGRQLGIG